MLVVNAVRQDVPFTATMTAAVNQEIADLAGWLTLDLRHAGGAGGPARAGSGGMPCPHAGSRASDLAGENCATCAQA